MPFLWLLVASLVLGLWFTAQVFMINCCGTRPFKDIFCAWKKHLFDKISTIGRDTKEDARNLKRNDNKSQSVFHETSSGNHSSLYLRERNRVDMRKAHSSWTPRSQSSVVSTSPPQTPRALSYLEFAPEAMTSSSVYSTPIITPVHPVFPSTNFPTSSLRHRSHVPPSLIVEPPSPSSVQTGGLDLEGQEALQTPVFSSLRPGPSRNSSGNSLPTKEEGKNKLARIGSKGWIAGTIDKVADGLVRYTRDADGDEGMFLPLSESSTVGRF